MKTPVIFIEGHRVFWFEWRMHARWRQADVAAILGVATAQASRIETGAQVCTLVNALKFADALGIGIEKLFESPPEAPAKVLLRKKKFAPAHRGATRIYWAEWRISTGWTQADVAGLLGISKAMAAAIENGRCDVGRHIIMFAFALGVASSKLEEPPPRDWKPKAIAAEPPPPVAAVRYRRMAGPTAHYLIGESDHG